MACPTTFEQLMSLQLDGLITPEDERRLRLHVARCNECAEVWGAMRQANMLLLASAREPAPLPQDFTLKVMVRLAASPAVVRPQLVEPEPAQPVAVPGPVSVLPPMGRPLGEYEQFPIQLPDYVQNWQERVAAYARGIVVVGLSLAGAVGLLLALVISGTLEVGEAFDPAVQMARTFFNAAAMWLRTFFAGVGVEMVGVAALLLGIIALAGWQIVANYHRAATEQRRDSAAAEAVP